MSYNAVRLRGARLNADQTGSVAFTHESTATVPAQLGVDPTGYRLGPITISTSSHVEKPLVVDDISTPTPGSISGFLGGLWPLTTAGATLGLAARARDHDGETTVSRRRVLQGAGLAAGGLLVAGDARADTDDQLYPIVELDVPENPGGLRVRLVDDDDLVLPDDELELEANGAKYDELSRLDDGTIPPGVDGEIRVAATEHASFLSSVRSFGVDDTLEWTLELDKRASLLKAGQRVTVSTDRFVVGALREAGTDRSTVTIAGESVPSTDEDDESTDVGRYDVDATTSPAEFVYEVGDDPPAESELVVRARVGRYEEFKDDASRVIQ